ncbi:MAG: thioredoxin family protein [Flavobacteriaceae bacterium]
MKIAAYICAFLFSISAFSQDWQKSYSEAVSRSKNESKPIVLVFSGSDWCAPCIKLDRAIWQSDDFNTYAKEHYILYKADFPRKKANRLSQDKIDRNNALADTFNPRGHFPLVVLLNSDEHVLGTTGYTKVSPKEYITLLNSFIK